MSDAVQKAEAVTQGSVEVSAEKAAAPPAPLRILSLEERNDLRKFVLGGGVLDLEQAKAVIDTARQGRGIAAMAEESKPKKRTKKAGMSDADLDASLDSKLKGL